MANFFIIDSSGQKHGAFTPQQLKELAARGKINPQTPLETDTGHKGTAGQIPGLFATTQSPFAQPSMPSPPPMQQFPQPPPYAAAQLVIERPSTSLFPYVFDIFVNGQKMGQIARGQTAKLSVPTGMVGLQMGSRRAHVITPTMINFTVGQEKKVTLRLKEGYTLKLILLSILFLPALAIYPMCVPPFVIEEEI